jgi:hypothetical protein
MRLVIYIWVIESKCLDKNGLVVRSSDGNFVWAEEL